MTTSKAITINAATIEQDEHGRYSLNDLHRAAGGEKRHQPSNFLQGEQTQALAREINPEIQSWDSRSAPIWVTNGGERRGTYVVRELVYAYAMWISPAFHLKVIRAFDALATGNAPPAVPRTMAQALRLAAEQAERLEEQERLLDAQAPKVEAHARFLASDGTFCVRDTAKVLGIRERAFIERLLGDGVLYRTEGGSLRAHAEHEEAGRFCNRTGSASRNGHAFTQVRVTPVGLDWLAKRYPRTDAPTSVTKHVAA